MKPIKMLLMAVVTILSVSVFAQESSKLQTKDSKQPSEKIIYRCPMHPEVTSDKPGKCPKCGMALKASGKTTTIYACPMHPEVTSDKPGKCSKCGMALKATEKAAQAYVCPMHADVTSDKPGKCSKCGMALVKKG